MELQWPLILFTTLIAASAGLFGAQGCYALADKGRSAQKPALALSFALMVAGGIAVFFHLQHWERIFNGFGHISSGITQELILIVLMFVVMVAYFVYLRRGDGALPKWLGAAALVVSVALVCVMGHSYLMPSRPAWDSAIQIASLLGAACAMGAGMFAALDGKTESDYRLHGIVAIVGSVAALVLTIAYLCAMARATGSFISMGNYFDPTHPNAGMVDPASLSPFSSASMGFTVASLVFAIAAFAMALVGRKTNRWVLAGWAIALCSLVAALLLRVVFYHAGGSVFLFY